jgi:hypothetical protein
LGLKNWWKTADKNGAGSKYMNLVLFLFDSKAGVGFNGTKNRLLAFIA